MHSSSSRPLLKNGAIVYVRTEIGQRSDVFTISLDGSRRHQLTHDSAWKQEPSFSPDGRRIAFARGKLGATGLYIMHADGSHLRRLVRRPAGYSLSSPAWSPDGNRIAYLRVGRSGASHLYVVDLRRPKRRRYINIGSSVSPEGGPTWAPDGRSLIVSSIGHLRRVNLKSGASKQITEGLLPAWSRNGRSIAFLRYQPLNSEPSLYVIRPDGHGIRRLVDDAWSPAWSPDSKLLLYTPTAVDPCHIFVLNPATGKKRDLTEEDPGVCDGWPDWARSLSRG